MTRWPIPLLVLATSIAHAEPTRGTEPQPKPKPTATAATTVKEKTKAPPMRATMTATASTKAIVVKGGLLTAGTLTTGVTQQPPPPKGWPHAIQTATTTNCARGPAPNEVMVYTDSAFGGVCSVLVAGFYPYSESLLVGNDSISSIKVGTDVRARAFKDTVYGGGWSVYPPGSTNAGLGAWNDQISSFRVEPANRSETCDDVQEGEVALYENSYMHGDCVVLPGDGAYANAEAMGIANDSISSMKNVSAKTMTAFWDTNFGGYIGAILPPHTLVNELTGDGFLTKGINDNISSAQMQ